MQINKLTVRGFLGARDIELAMPERVQLIAGRNGAGKSSIRDAIALALTADLGRVTLKKEAQQLVHAGADHALCEVVDGDGVAWHVTITAGGKIADGQKGREPDPVLPYVLGGQRLAGMSPTDRRAFLFGLAGIRADTKTVRASLIASGCDAARVDRVLPLLRSGFPAAAEEAKTQATAAKGAWRELTGENYGSEKAKTWRAQAPAVDRAEIDAAAQRVANMRARLGVLQQQLGAADAQNYGRQQLAASIAQLEEAAGLLARRTAKLNGDRELLASQRAELARLEATAGVAQREGVVHDLARSTYALLVLGNVDRDSVVGRDADRALAAYVAEHGPVTAAAGGDAEARAALPRKREAVELMERAVAASQRDADASTSARDQLTARRAELVAYTTVDDAQLRADLADLQSQTLAAERVRDRLQAQAAAVASADQTTAKAAAAHAAVESWTAIADRLGPDGIPAEMLAQALGPIRERLAQSASDSSWPEVEIAADMTVTMGGRDYRLLSESEQWRADAMLAEVVAHVSGARLLVLDRFDLLDLPGRAQCLEWLDTLGIEGEIDTAIVIGTLKALPAGLSERIGAHWIEAGVSEHALAAA
ncbi:MAG: RecF protein [Pseudomonadota bacterium]